MHILHCLLLLILKISKNTQVKGCGKNNVTFNALFFSTPTYEKNKDIKMEIESRETDWTVLIFIGTYHVLLALTLPFYFYYYSVSWELMAISTFLFVATGISITGGYHRFYSHRTYKANKIMECGLLLFGTMAGQGSALRWSNDHRIHHAHVDTDKDPYSISKGFWYAHILWLFEMQEPIEPRVVKDLLKNKLVVFQDKYYDPLFIGSNFLAFLAVGWMLNDFVGAFFISWWFRLFVLHHSTWFINSLAHMWGSKSYCKEISAVDNYIISFLTFGEGYHNYHHSFATDYRNGIRWYHFDPTKWMIWGFSKLGMANQLKKIDNYKVQKRIVKKDKDLLLDWIKQISYVKVDVLELKIHEAAEKLVKSISDIAILNKTYCQQKQQKTEKNTLKKMRSEIKDLKKILHEEWNNWLNLFDDVMVIKPIISL